MTAAQKNAIIATMAAIYETIRDLGGVPSGHLYARLMGRMSLDTYNLMISTLKQQGLVSESGHYLTANALPEKAAT